MATPQHSSAASRAASVDEMPLGPTTNAAGKQEHKQHQDEEKKDSSDHPNKCTSVVSQLVRKRRAQSAPPTTSPASPPFLFLIDQNNKTNDIIINAIDPNIEQQMALRLGAGQRYLKVQLMTGDAGLNTTTACVHLEVAPPAPAPAPTLRRILVWMWPNGRSTALALHGGVQAGSNGRKINLTAEQFAALEGQLGLGAPDALTGDVSPWVGARLEGLVRAAEAMDLRIEAEEGEAPGWKMLRNFAVFVFVVVAMVAELVGLWHLGQATRKLPMGP